MAETRSQMNERMNIVIVGHVDHGKSTLVGRLLVDTGSLPEGKLDQVRRTCELNAKPFEFAFLLDALIDEQAQGITIDTARIFFKSARREYILIDAPGHIEFLKNMISGAARAEAAILLIDAEEGIAENSKRHAYMLSMLGIKQIAVAVNKMDLINYDEQKFKNIKTEYSSFLEEIGIVPFEFIPVSARNGINITENTAAIPWYHGRTIIEVIDGFTTEPEDEKKDFRMFVQDVYKFTANHDDRRIVAGTINSGTIHPGDEIVFHPSGKISTVKSIEIFGKDSPQVAGSDQAIGLTLTTQVYVKASELISRTGERAPHTTERLRANIFWMGKRPLVTGKSYKLKIGTQKVSVNIEKIEQVLDASALETSMERKQVNRHEVSQCIMSASSPFSFDLVSENKITSRFVLVDGYDIAGGGIITHALKGLKPEDASSKFSQFQIELNNLIQKHFPNWDVNL